MMSAHPWCELLATSPRVEDGRPEKNSGRREGGKDEEEQEGLWR